jgi:CubicO group peptidase (beta-lactamase class C family)
MNKRKVRFWMIVVFVLLIAGLLMGGLDIFGLLPWQHGKLYEDPRGRFTIETDPSWEQVKTDGRYVQFKVPDPAMNMYLLVLDAGTVDDAFAQAIKVVGFDPGLLGGDNVTTFGDWQAYQQSDSEGISYGLAGQIVGANAFVLMVKGDRPGVSPESASILRALASLKIASKEEIVIESYTDLEALVRKEVDRLAGSMSIAIVHGNDLVYTYAYGKADPVAGIPADTQTIYSFGSMTKVFTASALMQLVEQGKVDLDAWPGKYIPEFPKNWNVTVRQLLDHSACMPDSDRLTNGLILVEPGETFAPYQEIFTSYVKDYPNLVCEPGKTSVYANSHYLALARIIEEVSGEPYVTYVVDHLLTPLAARSITFPFVEADERYAKDQYPESKTAEFIAQLNEYRKPGQEALVLQHGERFSTLNDYQILPPWGGLRGTPSDVTHFLQMHLNGGRYGDSQILKPETVTAMQQMQTSTDGSPLGFGLSWKIGEDEFGSYYYHVGDGAGSEATMRFYPDLNLGVVVMANVRGYLRDKIVAGLVNAWMHQK